MNIGVNYKPNDDLPPKETVVRPVTSLTPGVKFDEGKLPWHLLPPDALDAVLDVLAYGAHKYSERNWEKGMDWNRPFSALMRHMWAYWRGEDYDKETGMLHTAHAAACILFLLAYQMRGIGVDNRPTGVAQDDD